ncbi:MAG TPA: hypothetical protein VNX68_11530 [Nitrosopumilaceae archaeon]|jgi:hypothetical protein|nr:hypothetical protein [Nitrosopumilaceae archaeon]
MTSKEILTQARKSIENPDRWGKGPAMYRPGTCCASEAIKNVQGATFDERSLARGCLFRVIGGVFKRPITLWNDDPKRTHKEVLQAFDEAIEIA